MEFVFLLDNSGSMCGTICSAPHHTLPQRTTPHPTPPCTRCRHTGCSAPLPHTHAQHTHVDTRVQVLPPLIVTIPTTRTSGPYRTHNTNNSIIPNNSVILILSLMPVNMIALRAPISLTSAPLLTNVTSATILISLSPIIHYHNSSSNSFKNLTTLNAFFPNYSKPKNPNDPNNSNKSNQNNKPRCAV
jgi:hypothetical protein